ncbi:MAG: hypothetical protein HYV18_08240 [Gammaproteobacteria bacterium]|nr:hypothetical protein [Gammaproteobacteria bacterium]
MSGWLMLSVWSVAQGDTGQDAPAADSAEPPAVTIKAPAAPEERTLSFVSPPEMSPVPVKDVLAMLQREAYKLTQYSAPKDAAGKSGASDISGLNVTTGTDGMTFAYVRGTREGNDERATRSTGKIAWIVKEEGTQVAIVMSPPGAVKVEEGKAGMFGKIEPLDKSERLAADMLRVYNHLKGSIQRSVLVQGDADVEYEEKAIYANFERILGKYVPAQNDPVIKAFDPNRGSNFYKLRRGDTVQPVQVTIYPYRDKSKAVFEFFYSYYVVGDGTNTYSEQDVQSLKEKLAAIARD